MNRDLLNSVSASATAVTAFKLVDAMQGERPHMQVAAAGALFLAICDQYRVHPAEVSTVIRNMFNDIRYVGGNAEHFRAIRDYIKYELT